MRDPAPVATQALSRLARRRCCQGRLVQPASSVISMSSPLLHGKVAVVAVEQDELARRLAAAGATVVLVGSDGDRAGRVLAAIEAEASGRGAYFATGSGGGSAAEADALVAFVAEQFRSRSLGA